MTAPNDALLEALKLLRIEYLKDAPQRVAELRSLLAGAERGEGGALDELRRALHKLAGSGGSYGYPELSARSRAGEVEAQRLLDTHAPVSASALGTLRVMVEGVAAAFAAAADGSVEPQ